MLDPAQPLDTSIFTVQLNKIRGACQRARENDLKWIWIDFCCFNKHSSEETNRSINAMFRWYQRSVVCYTYLSHVGVLSTGSGRVFQRYNDSAKDSEWFEDGVGRKRHVDVSLPSLLTDYFSALQELLAPPNMEFCDKYWKHLGSRKSLAPAVSAASGIDETFLQGIEAFRSASIAKRLAWQARRITTKLEDIAYSLVGILGVHLVSTCGEGRGA